MVNVSFRIRKRLWVAAKIYGIQYDRSLASILEEIIDPGLGKWLAVNARLTMQSEMCGNRHYYSEGQCCDHDENADCHIATEPTPRLSR